MRLTQRLVDKSKERLLTPAVLRWVTDDRVMKATEGLMDARMRVKAAWDLLLNGHALPNVDPALDESIGKQPVNGKKNGAVNGVNGTNGHAHGDGELGHPSAAALNGNGVKVNGTNGAHAQMHGSEDMEVSMKERSSLASIGGRDVLEKCQKFMAADNARKRGIYPFFRPLDLNDGPEAVINGRRVVMFGSNNYLGLTTHPKVREAAKAAIDRFGTSMTGSRLVNGSMKLHEEFEEKLARYFGKESALVFTTGYQVNLAMCAALLSNKQSVAVIDRNVHASLYDGARLGQAAGATLVRYRHTDAESLDKVRE
jgi:hypothetical protein